ncbi:MAG TPA: hypothetical protein VGI98_01510 [Candidatus Limnocylindrales bacterium]|jgi:hypothetical protein
MTPKSVPAAAMAGGPATNLAPVPAPAPAPEPTHPCIRCGRPVADPSAGLCEQCNPLELAQPSATQVHGIAAAGIVIFVVLLAVAAHAALSGTGPFTGSVVAVTPATGGLAVVLDVRNAGTKAGATTCQITPLTGAVGKPGDLVQTPPIPAAGSLRFTATVTQLGTKPIDLVADCQSP